LKELRSISGKEQKENVDFSMNFKRFGEAESENEDYSISKKGSFIRSFVPSNI